MSDISVTQSALKLVNNNIIANIGMISEDGFPLIRAMVMLEHDGLKKFWFYSHLSSIKAHVLRSNNKSSLYFQDFIDHNGLNLVGHVELLTDNKSRERFWQDSFQGFFPRGILDPDMVIIQFTAIRGRFYNSKISLDFEV